MGRESGETECGQKRPRETGKREGAKWERQKRELRADMVGLQRNEKPREGSS